MKLCLLRIPLLLALTGVSLTAASFSKQVRLIFEHRCAGCHNQENPAGKLALTGYEQLAESGVVSPGHPEQSRLFQAIGGEKPSMPKAGPPLQPAEVEVIRAWITEGAVDDTPPEAYFQQNVAAILEQNCLRCHNAAKKTSGLSLTARPGALAGGRRGPAIVPGHPDQSPLISMISGPKQRPYPQ